MGQYVINSAAGIRTHPYSTSAYVYLQPQYFIPLNTVPSRSTNPLRYSSIKTLNEVHSESSRPSRCHLAPELNFNQTSEKFGLICSTTSMPALWPLTAGRPPRGPTLAALRETLYSYISSLMRLPSSHVTRPVCTIPL